MMKNLVSAMDVRSFFSLKASTLKKIEDDNSRGGDNLDEA
jgi:hypothetical protein